MGQYWIPVNLDKREYVDPHQLGTGLKLWEQLANHPGTGSALIILCAAMPTPRGGGDFDLEENWHGPERTFPAHNATGGPMPSGYPDLAKITIGRWAGDRIALVGDYAEDGDLQTAPVPASRIYSLCNLEEGDPDAWKDVSSLVAAVIEHELQGRYEGEGWRTFKPLEEQARR